MKRRKMYTSGFKTKVVLEALQKRDTIQELAKKYDLHPAQISTWKGVFLSRASRVFGKGWAIDNIFIERFWRSINYEKNLT